MALEVGRLKRGKPVVNFAAQTSQSADAIGGNSFQSALGVIHDPILGRGKLQRVIGRVVLPAVASGPSFNIERAKRIFDIRMSGFEKGVEIEPGEELCFVLSFRSVDAGLWTAP